MAEEVVIDLNVNSSQAIKSLDKFGLTVEGLKESEVEPLTFAISELEDKLYEMSAAGKSGTKEFRDMAKEVGRLKKTVLDTDAVVDGFAEGVGTSLGGAIEGVAGAFSIAQGALGAFGMEGDKVEEAMLRVQSAMAIAQGIQSVRTGIQSFKALRASIMATTVVQKVLNVVMSLNPIGLIIAGVVALGAAIYALWGPIKQFLQFLGIMEDDAIDVAAAHKKITAEYEAQLKAMKALQKQREADHKHEMSRLERRHKRMIETMEEEGASHEEITAEMRRQTEERFKAESEGLKKSQEERKSEYNLNLDTIRRERAQYKEAKRQGEYDKAREIKDSINKKKEENRGLLFEIRNHQKNVENLTEDHVDRLDEIEDQARQKEEQRQREALSRYKDYLNNKLEARRRIEDLETELIKDENERRLEELRLSFEREVEETKKKTTNKEQQERLITLLTEKYTRERGEITRVIEAEQEELNRPMRMRAVTEHKEMELAKTQYTTEGLKERQDKRDQDAEQERQLNEQKVNISQQSLTAINDLVQAFAGENEKAQRRAFNVNKAVGIAQAVINTAKAITKVFAETTDFTPTQSLRIANAVSIGVAGAAQVATIARTQFQGGGGASGAGGSISVPSVSAVAPTFDNIGDTGVNQLAQTLGQQGKQPLKTYVVSGDVTSAQSLDRKKIQNSTL